MTKTQHYSLQKTILTAMKKLLMLPILLICLKVSAQSLNANWQENLDKSLEEFIKCTETAESAALCYRFSGESVQKVYGVNDFFDKNKQRYMLIDEIYAYLQSSDKWTLLGKGYDQDALRKSQEQANAGKAVVAIKMREGEAYGHMAIILPGELGPSGSWGLRVPNSASFFTHQPDRSFINKTISYAFTASDRGYVMIYGHK
jgi:hypothetical protein